MLCHRELVGIQLYAACLAETVVLRRIRGESVIAAEVFFGCGLAEAPFTGSAADIHHAGTTLSAWHKVLASWPCCYEGLVVCSDHR